MSIVNKVMYNTAMRIPVLKISASTVAYKLRTVSTSEENRETIFPEVIESKRSMRNCKRRRAVSI